MALWPLYSFTSLYSPTPGPFTYACCSWVLHVLSVGDGAFAAKSASKMREIIRGGATTILVSHSVPQIRAMCNKILWLDNGRQIVFTDDVEGACDCYEEFLKDRSQPPVYDPVAAKARIDARAAEKARREAEARQMRIDAEKLKKVREILRRGRGI